MSSRRYVWFSVRLASCNFKGSDISGRITGAKAPEASVWMIAETILAKRLERLRGRGLWATYSTRAVFHTEGGTTNRPRVVKFQVRD